MHGVNLLPMLKLVSLVAIALFVATAATGQVKSVMSQVPLDTLMRLIQPSYVGLDRAVKVRTIVTEDEKMIRVRLSDNASQLPITKTQLAVIGDSLRHWLGLADAELTLTTSRVDLSAQAVGETVACGTLPQGSPVVCRDDNHGGPLTGRNIAFWASHGRYYESSLSRWEWQRGRLNTTVEDLLTPSFAYPFLIPMLENAGAMVFSPRERDTTSVVTIVDDGDGEPSFTSTRRAKSTVKGFGRYTTLHAKDNPFTLGNACVYKLSANDSITFSAKANSTGPAMLYFAYPPVADATSTVSVTVRHAAGEAHFTVDQRMGGGFWMPMGMLPFRQGMPFVVVIKGKGLVSADAVRIGGGMGVVGRDGATSGRPAWHEAARYYLQSDGFDYTKVLSVSNGQNEYTDDVNCRGEWVNALVNDKHIPIDLSLALHTDAFVTHTDSVIGTLCLITTNKLNGSLPDGRNTLTSRQLAWHVMNALANDIHRTYDTDWTIRGIADKKYSESRRPNVPALLLELLSHQNISDMGHALNPAFRRDAARSIYKGVARYLAGVDAPISPLPPSRIGLRFVDTDTIALHWSFTPDTLESSAITTAYEVYEGERLILTTVDTSALIRQPLDGKIRTYRVIAIGPGGRSLPSEAVPACLWRGGRKALLVEGMDRLAPPTIIQSPQWSGVMLSQDPGAPWASDAYTTGEQYDFSPNNPWLDDDAPGCGASYSDLECRHFPSATTYTTTPSHVASAMRLEGYSFVGVTKSFFDSDTSRTDTTTYSLIRVNLDRQRATLYGDAGIRHQIYTDGFRRHLDSIIANGTPTVISGSFVGSDIQDPTIRDWCANTLGFKFRTAHATRTFSTSATPRLLREYCLTTRRPEILFQQADAIEPALPGARTIFRYNDSQMSAAVSYGSVIVVGF